MYIPPNLTFVLEILLFMPTLLLVTLSHLPIGIQSVTITVHRREKRRWTMWPLRTQCGRRGQRLYMAVLYQFKFHTKPGLFLVMFSNQNIHLSFSTIYCCHLWHIISIHSLNYPIFGMPNKGSQKAGLDFCSSCPCFSCWELLWKAVFFFLNTEWSSKMA
jgi:hypothetical protein